MARAAYPLLAALVTLGVLARPAPADEVLEPSDAPVVAPARDTTAPPAAADTAAAVAPAVPADSAAVAPSAASGTAPDSAAAAPSVSPGPGELTIEVDAAQSRNRGKSLPLAMAFSAVLPGAGEAYLGEKGRAKAFLLAEAGFWASLYAAFLAKESYLESARNSAATYAGIDASSKDEDFLETMGRYRAYQEKQHRQDSYELDQILSGRREQDYDIAPSPENYWDFGSSANPENTRNWRRYQRSLRFHRASKVAVSFAIGALALNRLGSLVNTLQTYKRTSAQGLGFELEPDLGPDHAGSRLTVRF